MNVAMASHILKLGATIGIASSDNQQFGDMETTMDYLPDRLLYRGVGARNNGVITTVQNHLNDTTKSFGNTIDYASALGDKFIEVFVGVTDGINKGVVSPNSNHCGGATESIGMLALEPLFPHAQKLYVGTGASNNGVATPDQMHLNDTTAFLGYALPL